MCPLSTRVNRIAYHHGQSPKPDPVLRAILGAQLLQYGAYGVRTGTAAAIAVGVSRPQLDAASIILRSGDENLIANMRNGRNPKSGGMLCIGCVEDRTGRRLCPKDFKVAPINDPADFSLGSKSARLMSRITGNAEARIEPALLTKEAAE